MSDFAIKLEKFHADAQLVQDQLASVIVGNREVIEDVLICLFAGGHVLIEGVPGTGKTMLVKTLSQVLNLDFSRIQFTPDLMPADITGTEILAINQAGEKKFSFEPGPIFANLVLADEINRATPKTQSAILEAMQDRTVTSSGVTRDLPAPMMVLATQNPIEMEGTYPLPEAQLDRFMLKTKVSAPSSQELADILNRTTGTDSANPKTVLSEDKILAYQQVIREIKVSSQVTNYIADLVSATHPDSPVATEMTRENVEFGASPRGAQAIMLGAKVLAARDARANICLDDVKKIAPSALRHRIILNFKAQAKSLTTDELLTDLLGKINPR